ncbi:MAG: VWA domain-containing protein [Anaerolineae bacterium]
MPPKRLHLTGFILLLLAAVLAACGGAEVVEEVVTTPAGIEEPDYATGSERSGDVPPPPETGGKVAATRVAPEAAAAEAEAVRSEAPADAMSVAPSTAGETAAELPPSTTFDQNSRLTAGEVDDNARWDDYLLYLRHYSGAAVVEVAVQERYQIRVTDTAGNPVLSARISIAAAGQEVMTLRTHSNGLAYFFPRALNQQADSYRVTVTADSASETFDIPAGGSQREWVVTLQSGGGGSQEARLDVLFLIDATGSMADEIFELKANIEAIAAQVDALPSRPNVRFGMVAYRDRGDEYVTRLFDFTPDVQVFAEALAEVNADGGGDYPEDLNEALSRAIHEPEWRVEGAVNLIFLVADAPPHLDYGQQNHYAAESLEAARRGIKIYPIASSGLDSQGEYIFRQLAQITGGRFIFLTYGPEGAGPSGTETTFEVSDYTVSALDDLVVGIIEEELSYLR